METEIKVLTDKEKIELLIYRLEYVCDWLSDNKKNAIIIDSCRETINEVKTN